MFADCSTPYLVPSHDVQMAHIQILHQKSVPVDWKSGERCVCSPTFQKKSEESNILAFKFSCVRSCQCPFKFKSPIRLSYTLSRDSLYSPYSPTVLNQDQSSAHRPFCKNCGWPTLCTTGCRCRPGHPWFQPQIYACYHRPRPRPS